MTRRASRRGSAALVLLVGAGVLAVGCGPERVAAPAASAPDVVAPSVSPAAPAAAARHRASDVLRAWDLARSRAYAAGDPAALRRLYVPGSRAGTSDVRVLRAYARRGLRVEGMRMQVLALEVLRDEPRLLRIEVTDRLVGAVAVGVGGSDRVRLPRDTATSREVVLRRFDGRWRVAAVRG